jgi:hypothetical protein
MSAPQLPVNIKIENCPRTGLPTIWKLTCTKDYRTHLYATKHLAMEAVELSHREQVECQELTWKESEPDVWFADVKGVGTYMLTKLYVEMRGRPLV